MKKGSLKGLSWDTFLERVYRELIVQVLGYKPFEGLWGSTLLFQPELLKLKSLVFMKSASWRLCSSPTWGKPYLRFTFQQRSRL